MDTAWAAEAAKAVSETPIFLTWNFFLTAFGLPALGWFLARLITKKDQLQFDNLSLWQQGAAERNKTLNEKLERIERCIASVKDDIKERVHNEVCRDKHTAVKEELHDIKAKLFT